MLIKKNVFYVITKNLNSEVLTKNLVTFKWWDGVTNENIKFMGFTEESDFYWAGLDNLKI